MRDFPNLDEARLADWAEGLATSMEARGSGITSPKKFAYPALRGRVLDSLRTGSAKEQSFGMGRDLELIGGSSGSFEGTVDRKILFDQLQNALSHRDRDILLLILNEKSAPDVAAKLNTSSPAARKAIQRVKERIGALLGASPKGKDVGKRSVVNQRGLAVE
jgi:DNA-directed RNA polymerase specialized sigma24 family protein